MRARHIGLLAFLLAAFALFIATAIVSPTWSAMDVGSCAVFGALLVYGATRLLGIRENSEDQPGLPALLRAAFASLALAMALAMLLSIAALPLLGPRVFESFTGQEAAWSLPLIAAILYPFVRRRLR